jgi:hypothetical protein
MTGRLGLFRYFYDERVCDAVINEKLFESIRNFAKDTLQRTGVLRPAVFFIRENAIVKNYLNFSAIKSCPIEEQLSTFFQVGKESRVLNCDHVVYVLNSQSAKIQILPPEEEETFSNSTSHYIWILVVGLWQMDAQSNLTEYINSRLHKNFIFQSSGTFQDNGHIKLQTILGFLENRSEILN